MPFGCSSKPSSTPAADCPTGSTTGCPAKPKTLKVKVVIVKGTYWDSEEGRKKIEKQLKEAEKDLGIKIETGPYETVDDAGMKAFPNGQWNGTNNYSPELVKAVNKYGTSDSPALIFNDDPASNGKTLARTVGKPWAGTDDGLTNEGIVFGKGISDTDGAHELGHLLSGKTGDDLHSDDKNNLMYGYTDRTGTNWTDPWKSAADSSPYLK